MADQRVPGLTECPECGLPTERYGEDHPWDCGPEGQD